MKQAQLETGKIYQNRQFIVDFDSGKYIATENKFISDRFKHYPDGYTELPKEQIEWFWKCINSGIYQSFIREPYEIY